MLLATEWNKNQSRELQADNISDIHGAPYVSDRNIVVNYYYCGQKHMEHHVCHLYYLPHCA